MIERSVDDADWMDLVRSHAGALAFHHPNWTHMLAECYDFRAFVLALDDTRGNLVGGLPVVEVGGRVRRTRWVSLPFTDVCPPLVVGDAGADLLAQIERARLDAGVASVEVRAPLAGRTSGACSLSHVLQLGASADDVARRFRPSVRRNIRTAAASGAEIRVADCEADLTHAFYRLHVATRRRLGLPVQPRRFFALVWRRMLDVGLGRALLAHVGGDVVAGGVFLTWNGTVVYKYGASDPRFWPLRPNNLLFAEAIRWACESGYERFDFGRTNIDAQSLRRFKLGWGAEERPLEYTTIGVRAHDAHRPAKPVRAVLRRSPGWVARAVGELMYRHAA